MPTSKKSTARKIKGVDFEPMDNYAICHVKYLSDDIKALIRMNLATICHGSHVNDFQGAALYTYETTLLSFLDRYGKKSKDTQLGMIGEFMAHILIAELFPEFTVVSAFFNLEEKSIKKGFDLLLYKSSDSSMWITEVKSGNLHKSKDQNQTTRDLLNTAKADLLERLNAQETMYWYNAVNNVRTSLSNEKDYKNALLGILVGHGGEASKKTAASKDKAVILVSSLFEPCDTPITLDVASDFSKTLVKNSSFSKVIVFCMQKATHSRVAEFLAEEAAGAVA